MRKTPQKTFEDILNAWATRVPADMQHEPPRERILDAALQLFDNLSSANITRLPPRPQLIQVLHRAVHWQWIALNIPMPPLFSAFAPKVLTLAFVYWLWIWQNDKTPGQGRLMAVIDRDLGRLFAAAQYVLPPQND